MELNKLKELNEKVLFLTSTLDALTEDYCGAEDDLIRQSLEGAWYKLDAALDNIYYEVVRREKNPEWADPEPVTELDKELFKDLLRDLTVENVQEAHRIVGFFFKQLEDEEAKKLSHDLKATFLAALLVEYGRLKASKKRRAQAADPEGKEGD